MLLFSERAPQYADYLMILCCRLLSTLTYSAGQIDLSQIPALRASQAQLSSAECCLQHTCLRGALKSRNRLHNMRPSICCNFIASILRHPSGHADQTALSYTFQDDNVYQ
ncbi:hypothetical protein An09g01960 [Aspergillus niger]|uniref:Uncharacterized protein n=2 Tax=Aspergillus niger TaxID=5061 RepID=A2QTF9_ASPNC|nr:hypothetical protein An09g01960 [Aspergillus niger]CAK40134.1 hypothetical protein An09g01960 [Aspergillus niger]